MQKILRNGRTITIFTIGTGGMFDQRVIGSADTPKPAQWHRIAVHSEHLGAYAVQKLVKKYVIQIQRFHLFSPHIDVASLGFYLQLEHVIFIHALFQLCGIYRG